MSEKPLLRPEEVASVLSGDDETQPHAEPGGPRRYSLREPLVIAPADEPEARRRGETWVRGLEAALRSEVGGRVDLRTEGFRQQPAASTLAAVPDPAWILAFGTSGGGGVALLLHPLSGLALVELTLGGTGKPHRTPRAPTALESRVVCRLAASLAPALTRECGLELPSAALGVGRVPSAFAREGETVGVALLRARIGDDEHRGAVMISTSLLRARQEPDAVAPRPPSALVRRLPQVRVELRPVFRAGSLTLEHLAGLRPRRVLALAGETEPPVEIRVEGCAVLGGRLRRDATGMVVEIDGRRLRQ